MKLNYLLLDVFTRDRLKGNQLAVVTKADGLLDGEMQAIAREFNLSETVFMLKPQAERNTAAIRIFTPYAELPFAGHPTVGAAVVLGLQNKVTAVRLEEKIGLITALFEKIRQAFAGGPLCAAAPAVARCGARPTSSALRWPWASRSRISAATTISRPCFRQG